MSIKLYNTATRSKEVFTPIDDKNVRMYVCGPTVYDRAHLGNARPVVVFDVLNRLLRHTYGDDNVTYVRNFTDVDDKINATALARKEAGAEGTIEELVRERSDETIRWYHEDMDALGTLHPDHEPRATEYIRQMVEMIEELIAKGHAYAAEGHVLFKVSSYAEYGKLSGRKVEDMIAGARVEVAPYKEDPMDFVLWKPSTDELPGWDSPWGRGRPGWHIECSAMAFELLGERFDIHGGGNDLQFPHHENEIAQSKCMGHGFAEVWMHNEMLQVEGKKMSKSLGNFFTVRDLLEQGVPGEVIRFVMLSTHYRKPMDWTEKKRVEAEKTLRKWAKVIELADIKAEPSKEVLRALNDDLSSSLALYYLHHRADDAITFARWEQQGVEYEGRSSSEVASEFVASLELLGFNLQSIAGGFAEKSADLSAYEAWLSSVRAEAMRSNNFSELDRVKQIFIGAGVEVQMSKEKVKLFPTPLFDPSKLEALK